MKNNNTPEIRFARFAEDWEQSKLDSIVDRVKSYSLSRDVESSEYTGYKYIHYGDIHTKVADVIDESSNLPNIKAGNYELLEKGDLVLADASEDYQGIATPAVITIDTPYKLVSGLHTIALRPKQVDSLFLYYLINSQTFRKYGYKTGTGMKVFGISVTNLLKFEGMFSLLEEQTKIGNFLKQLDETISLHQQELTTLKQTKQGFLQKMLSKEGESLPEIRFPGFTGDWEQRKLCDVADMFDNLRIPVTASKRIKGVTPYYGANGVQDYVEGFTHDGEFVLVAEDGANDLINYPVNYVVGKVWVNNHAHVISGQKGILDNLFLVTRIRSMNISTYLVGGGRAKLNGETLKKIPVTIPNTEEQAKIGNFFKQLDDTIALHQRELDALKETKKAFLKKMFV